MIRRWAVTLLLITTLTPLSGEGTPQIRLTLQSPRAMTGIPVGSEIIVENQTGRAMTLPRWAYYRIHYLPADEWTIVRSPAGPYAIDVYESVPNVVAPGRVVRITDLPSLNLFSTILGGAAFLRPGTYMVDALLSPSPLTLTGASDPQHSSEVAALSAELVTPPVAFTVEEPRGDDALVWARIAAAVENRASLLGGTQRPGEWIRPLVWAHPDSAYVPYLSDYYGLDDAASAEFAAKWLARDLPQPVKEWLRLRRARALSALARKQPSDQSSRRSADAALSIAGELAKEATVPGLREEAQRIVDEINWRRTPPNERNDH